MSTKRNAQELPKAPAMSEQERMTYANMLKEARVKARLTQAEVAEQAGIALNTYSTMENGNRIPQAEKLWAAMLVLDLQPQDAEPEWLREWWAILKPLIMELPQATRGITMGRIVNILADAIRDGEPVGLKVVPKASYSEEDLEAMGIAAKRAPEDPDEELDGNTRI
ncbi:helix-turn-helix domain-containing protein [Scrofimicrobium canadense]|nr:helix-turn-helix transcriptional regulator [Scrofimicrobium canadense]